MNKLHYMKNFNVYVFMNLIISVTVITGQFNYYNSIQRLQNENNERISSLISGYKNDLDMLTKQIETLSNSLHSSNSTMTDSDLFINQKTTPLLNTYSSTIVEICYSPFFHSCLKTTGVLSIGYVSYRKLKYWLFTSSLYLIKGF